MGWKKEITEGNLDTRIIRDTFKSTGLLFEILHMQYLLYE